MVVFTQFTDPHLYYRHIYWLKNRKKIKKRGQRKKTAQKLKEDCTILIIILLIILNVAVYNDVEEKVLLIY